MHQSIIINIPYNPIHLHIITTNSNTNGNFIVTYIQIILQEVILFNANSPLSHLSSNQLILRKYLYP
ncbi:hypothetical protein BofuT4_uP075710.1 [Botrytis cinerea T4]|uniref:Uncharacterized protein n=1 Tax=Botryotinia fuckeliana (strain T4) TaxID=999810 RepID=G2XNN2_BOTF4|nr:hypothetical protein BofuT4_uP075710.1 [Botrytis cinerea T4]